MAKKVLLVGAGNAAMCAGLAALDAGAEVLAIDTGDAEMAGGNSKYTAGAMRFAYEGTKDILPLLEDTDDPRLLKTDFGSYPESKFAEDLLNFNEGRPLSDEQKVLIKQSHSTLLWLAEQGVKFNPIYERQSFMRDGRHIFWGGLTLAATGEGVGLVDSELSVFMAKGGSLQCQTCATELLTHAGRVSGVRVAKAYGETEDILADAVVLGCGGFEANAELRTRHLGPQWKNAKVRGTPNNEGWGLIAALGLGAQAYGFYGGCHATPMDLHMKDYGNLSIPHLDRKNYRKISYFLGIMLNAKGQRFVDEGMDFRNYTYAQFGGAVLDQPGAKAWQIFDAKVDDLLYEEYRFFDASFTQADTLEGLIEKLDGLDKNEAKRTVANYNSAVDAEIPFDPTIKDGKATRGLPLQKSNWAQTLDTPPFKAFPVTGGITFTYGGLKVGPNGEVLDTQGKGIEGLFACGELVGGVFFNGYPGGSGLTSGAVFGRRAGYGAAA